MEKKPSFTQSRRQTLHSHQPIKRIYLEDTGSTDTSDIYSIHEYKKDPIEKNHRQQMQTDLDEIITLSQSESLLKAPKSEERFPLKRINETNEDNRLLVPQVSLPISKFYGSTQHLFAKPAKAEENSFLQSTNSLEVPQKQGVEEVEINVEGSVEGDKELKSGIPKHDSQESVQRITSERRKLDENLKEYDCIFDVTHSSEENLVERDKNLDKDV